MNKKPFDFKDQIIIEMDLIQSAFAVLHSVDYSKIDTCDIENFCNGMAWYTEQVKNYIQDNIYDK